MTTPADVVAAAEALAPTITARADKVEAARRMPADLLDALRAAGCFRMSMPPSHGGLGADLATIQQVLAALARADASTAWTVMVGGGCWIDLAALPRATFDEVFDRPDVIVGGVFAPSGSITAVDGGYRVAGRWAFASGCEHADVLYANGVEGIVDGGPQLRTALLRPDDVQIEDTWTAAGLCGTGSHHFRVADRLVAADRTLRPFDDPPGVDAPILRIPPPTVISQMIAAVAVGVAQGAVDDLLDLADRKVPLLDSAPLAADPVFQVDLACVDTDVRAARALLAATAEEVWAAAVTGEPLTTAQRARARATAVWVVTCAAEVVTTAHRAAGSTAVYADSPLHRRMRDVHTLTQHFLVKRAALATMGAVLAGREVSTPVL
jgi:alkylation response protein AidB-like acyl-CoA dehydrogenase